MAGNAFFLFLQIEFETGMTKISIIGVPLFYGCDIPGVETGPSKLRSLGLAETLETLGHTVADRGDLAVPTAPAETKHACHPKMKYVAPIRELCRELSHAVEGVLDAGEFPLVIGGDHSAGIGTLAGVARHFGSDTAVLWIDSHSDIHEFATSASGNVHGVPLGAAMGLPCGTLNEVFADSHTIRGGNIFIVGLRSYEPEEMEAMTRHGVRHYSVKEIRTRGLDAVMDEIQGILKASGAPALHLSFDIDSLDPSIAPGTGIREADGFTEAEAAGIIRLAFATGLVRSMDISELNPLCDEGEMTSRLALRIAALIP